MPLVISKCEEHLKYSSAFSKNWWHPAAELREVLSKDLKGWKWCCAFEYLKGKLQATYLKTNILWVLQSKVQLDFFFFCCKTKRVNNDFPALSQWLKPCDHNKVQCLNLRILEYFNNSGLIFMYIWNKNKKVNIWEYESNKIQIKREHT